MSNELKNFEFDQTVVGEIYWHRRGIIGGVPECRKVTRGELKQVFDTVCNQKNWKLPIDATIPNPGPEVIALIREAIVFFTGSVARIDQSKVTVKIKAAGYYSAIGA